jgi:hypothetical protein
MNNATIELFRAQFKGDVTDPMRRNFVYRETLLVDSGQWLAEG